MNEKAQEDPYFDVRQSVRGRNITRQIIAPAFYVGLTWLGIKLAPLEAAPMLRPEAIETWNFWAIVGFFLIASGVFNLLKEFVFAVRARKTKGEWHFRLTEHDLLWQVPQHAHGEEEGFEAKLKELRQIEFRTIQKNEEIDLRQYWVHFHARKSVQLKSFSGVSLSWMVGKINAAGIPYEETFERY